MCLNVAIAFFETNLCRLAKGGQFKKKQFFSLVKKKKIEYERCRLIFIILIMYGLFLSFLNVFPALDVKEIRFVKLRKSDIVKKEVRVVFTKS